VHYYWLPFGALLVIYMSTYYLYFLFSVFQELYKDMTDRVNSVVNSGRIPEVPRCHSRGFSQWNENFTSSDHPSIVQVKVMW
jgi:hypothetical protein